MLRTDKPIYKVILVFNLLLIAAAVVLSVIALGSEGVTISRIVSAVIRLLALLFAGFYILSGYRKDAAKYFKLFGLLYMLSIILGYISGIINTPAALKSICDVLMGICDALIVIGILALVFVKDLGKAKSLAMCAVLVILQIAIVGLAYYLGKPAIVKVNMFIGIDLACLYGIMTYAKYLDKAERGTK